MRLYFIRPHPVHFMTWGFVSSNTNQMSERCMVAFIDASSYCPQNRPYLHVYLVSPTHGEKLIH